MSTGTIVAVIVVIVVVAAVAVAVISQARRRRLSLSSTTRSYSGPKRPRSRRQAEAELTQRERRVKDLDIRPLDPAGRARYAGQWTTIQEQFVDRPQEAVAEAQRLISTVMTERGYPTEQEDQVLADLSVEHAQTLDHYRAASDINAQAALGAASTEDLRQAMIHYRVLFQDLLGEHPSDQDVPVQDVSDREVPVEEVPVEEVPVEEVADSGNGRAVLDDRENIGPRTPRT
jgi:hypothetical protein